MHRADEIVGVALAAGLGTRLRPLTDLRPKALCPVANRALLDLTIEQLAEITACLAVNAHHLHDQITAHLDGRKVHVSVERPEPLGTAGAIGRLRDWVAGRAVVVANADAWRPGGLGGLVHGWDGERLRLLVVEDRARPDFHGRWRYAGAALLPWSAVRSLEPVPSGLYEVCWRQALAAGHLDLAVHDGPFIDCGTPADYLAANLAASGGCSVIGRGAVADGEVVRSVVWPGAVVRRGERLVEVIRAGTAEEPVTVEAGA